MREQYRAKGIGPMDLADEPMAQFGRWFTSAVSSGLFEPNAMIVSTADSGGRPSSRTVLLKHYDERGFVFFTNYTSRKAGELAGNRHISLLFPWHPIARQVIVTGTAERTGRDESAAYFRTRPYGSQLGAWASAQSSVVASRDKLEEDYTELAARYPEGEEVPVPPHWGGFRITPRTVEFWQGRENRLHDRIRYVRAEAEEGAREAPGARDGDGARAGVRDGEGWHIERLSP
ncbi:pyridoxamine 5'-phosphate oxidase [Streptomyces tsukubensis]|uniref:Pyridoxine/pyridoxamine 5'-phosphate oxidase n=1 Tax=Streptomyces tsukubensis TaxID=83656 RepID=A0A1V4A171_9ACTN|nr:pyridoxamine 5'-phosphate oxidase [Streptomyces tsukubensis]OON72264.1 pyridoxamine 5'-phosphate oxidase [Streptomyces tsukubensis]QFR97769.1 pyridoxamine 5'-phosphate oxidase [Streptomyces tsukubensis]